MKFLCPARSSALALALSLAFGAAAHGQSVLGASVRVYADSVPGPIRLAFAPDGTLFAGRDTMYSGSATAQFLTRIGPGGSPVEAFGQSATADPDPVVVDVAGVVSGVAGSVLTGGIQVPTTVGSISAVRPNGAVQQLWTSTAWVNPTDMKFDLTGRFLFSDGVSRSIWVSSGGELPTQLFTLPGSASPAFLAIAPDNRIFVADGAGRIYAYSSGGVLQNANVATFPSTVAIEFGQGGHFGTQLYALRIGAGTLHTVPESGTTAEIGSGLGTQLVDLAVGPDKNLYYSRFNTNQVLVIEPAMGVPNLAVSTYANDVPGPVFLSFAPGGALFVGRDVSYAGNVEPRFVTRVGVGGAPVESYGLEMTPDPDPVLYDPVGAISGVPGSVLTGGVKVFPTLASISAIRPNGEVVELWTSTVWTNPSEMKFDLDGRFLFTCTESRQVWQSTAGEIPTPLCTLPSGAAPAHLTIAPDNRIFVSDFAGRIYAYASNGTLLNGNVATFPSRVAIEFGQGGVFGTDLYALRLTTGELYRVEESGSSALLINGLGAQLVDLAFGPDQQLYYSRFAANQIGRIVATPAPIELLPGCFGNPADLSAPGGPATLGQPFSLALSTTAFPSGIALLYVGPSGVDAGGCGLFLPGLGEILLSFAPAPTLVAPASLLGAAAQWTLPVPNMPSLVGQPIAFQGAAVSLTLPGFPAELSNALLARPQP